MHNGEMALSATRLSIAAVVLAVALAGCAGVNHAPPPPSGAELATLTDQELHLQWQYMGLTPDEARPEVELVRYVSAAEANAVHQDCVTQAGYPEFSTVLGATMGAASVAERLVIFRCVAAYPLAPAEFGLYSAAQLDYIYDYYVNELVPCLGTFGFVVDDAPSRTEFAHRSPGSFFVWSPYVSVPSLGPVAAQAVRDRCPGYPAGLLDRVG
jgi:hypothetical protein